MLPWEMASDFAIAMFLHVYTASCPLLVSLQDCFKKTHLGYVYAAVENKSAFAYPRIGMSQTASTGMFCYCRLYSRLNTHRRVIVSLFLTRD